MLFAVCASGNDSAATIQLRGTSNLRSVQCACKLMIDPLLPVYQQSDVKAMYLALLNSFMMFLHMREKITGFHYVLIFTYLPYKDKMHMCT